MPVPGRTSSPILMTRSRTAPASGRRDKINQEKDRRNNRRSRSKQKGRLRAFYIPQQSCYKTGWECNQPNHCVIDSIAGSFDVVGKQGGYECPLLSFTYAHKNAV